MYLEHIVPARPVLQSFVSSNKSDVYRFQSENLAEYSTIPYACAYTNGKPEPRDLFLRRSHEIACLQKQRMGRPHS
jgi:hypothetical protein